jgi:hypothetical protein
VDREPIHWLALTGPDQSPAGVPPMKNTVVHASFSRRGLFAAGAAAFGFAFAQSAGAAELVIVTPPPAMRYEPLPPPPAGPPRSWVWLPGHWVWGGRA